MKASIAHGIRPTALILGKDSKKPWTKTDIMFAKAYQRFLNELCSQCGLPKYICHTSDSRVQFDIKRDECASSAKAERAQSEISSKKDAKPQFGIKLFGMPVLSQDAIAEGLEFSDLRRPYLMEEAKKQGLIADPVSGNQ